MNEPAKKEISIEASVVVKKSRDFKQVGYKATAGLSEAEAIKRFTVGNTEVDECEQEEA